MGLLPLSTFLWKLGLKEATGVKKTMSLPSASTNVCYWTPIVCDQRFGKRRHNVHKITKTQLFQLPETLELRRIHDGNAYPWNRDLKSIDRIQRDLVDLCQLTFDRLDPFWLGGQCLLYFKKKQNFINFLVSKVCAGCTLSSWWRSCVWSERLSATTLNVPTFGVSRSSSRDITFDKFKYRWGFILLMIQIPRLYFVLVRST